MKINLLCKILNSISLVVVILCISGASSAVFMGILAVFLTTMNRNEVSDSIVLISWIILFCLPLAGCLFSAWKYGRNKLVFEEKRSRSQSFLLWETSVFLLFFILYYISWLIDSDWPLWAGLCLSLIALIISLVFPFRYCPGGFWKMIRGLGLFCAFSVFFWGGLFLYLSGKVVVYNGNNPNDLPRSVRWISKTYIPERAMNISLKGRSTSFGWSCDVSRKDFQNFKAKSPMEFRKVTTPCSHYFYEYWARNGGGVTLRYYIEDERLTGFYSHH